MLFKSAVLDDDHVAPVSTHEPGLLYKPIVITPSSRTEAEIQAISLLDPGATAHFVDISLADTKLRNMKKRKKPTKVLLANGDTLVSPYQILLTYSLCRKKSRAWFNAIPLSPEQQLIVGRPWLTQFNPSIDWTTNEVSFNNTDYQNQKSKIKSQVYSMSTFLNLLKTSDMSTHNTLMRIEIRQKNHEPERLIEIKTTNPDDVKAYVKEAETRLDRRTQNLWKRLKN